MTAEESKKDCVRLLKYMITNQVSDPIQDTVIGLISVIEPREKAFLAMREMADYTEKNPSQEDMFHEVNRIYKKYQED